MSETSIYLKLDNVWEFLTRNTDQGKRYLLNSAFTTKIFPRLLSPWPDTTAWLSCWGGITIHSEVHELPEQQQTPGIRWTGQLAFHQKNPVLSFAETIFAIGPDGGAATDWDTWLSLFESDGNMYRHLVEKSIETKSTYVTQIHTDLLPELSNKLTPLIAYSTTELCARAFMFAVNLAHCKNVILEDHPEPRAERRRKQRAGIPQVTWKMLRIEPITRHASVEATVPGDNRIQQALHIARGHFKTFDEKPLFGKIKGTFWWNQQWRGKLNHGLVVKDYGVNPEAFDE